MSGVVAVCSSCGDFAYGPSQINHQCGKKYDGKRCRGIYEAAVHFTFQECPTCKGTGRGADGQCTQCSGRRMITSRFKG